MSFYVDVLRQYRHANGKLSDDSTRSHFKCDSTTCSNKRWADHDESVVPDGWEAVRDKLDPAIVYHACSNTDCKIEVLALSQLGYQGRSTD